MLLALVFIVVVALVAGGLWMDSSLHRIPALADYPERPAAGKGTTWLLVGSDSRQALTPEQQAELATGGDLGTGRTDTILLVHIPGLGSSTPTTMVSIPRDSYVEIPGYGSDKINAAFVEGGAPLLAQTVEQATGIRHGSLRGDRFRRIRGDGRRRGRGHHVPHRTDRRSAGGHQPAARVVRSSTAAARSGTCAHVPLRAPIWTGWSISARSCPRLLHRAASPAVWLNPLRWYPMAHAASGAVTVGEHDHIWDLARLAWALRGDVTTTTVPIGEFTGGDSGSVVVWNNEVAEQLFAALKSDAPVPQDVIDAQP